MKLGNRLDKKEKFNTIEKIELCQILARIVYMLFDKNESTHLWYAHRFLNI